MKKIPLLFITIDALGPELLSKADAPFINSLMESGSRVEDARSCFPTLTTPMMSTILTGCYPASHGVAANTMYFESKRCIKGKLRKLNRKTIGEILSEKGYSVLSVQHFMLENKADIDYRQVDGNKPEELTAEVMKAFDNKKYDAVFCIHQAVDSCGHKHGHLHRKTINALEVIDSELEKMTEKLKEVWGDFVIVLSSDHSMSTAETHSDFSIKKTLKLLGLRSDFFKEDEPIPENLDCLLVRYPTVGIFTLTEEAIGKKKEIIDILKNEPDIQRVYDSEEMSALGNTGYGDIGYCLKKGYTNVPEVALKVKKFGYHGTLDEEPCIINYWGYGVPEMKIAHSKLVDIVPTTLSLLNLEAKETFDGEIPKEFDKRNES